MALGGVKGGLLPELASLHNQSVFSPFLSRTEHLPPPTPAP